MSLYSALNEPHYKDGTPSAKPKIIMQQENMMLRLQVILDGLLALHLDELEK